MIIFPDIHCVPIAVHHMFAYKHVYQMHFISLDRIQYNIISLITFVNTINDFLICSIIAAVANCICRWQCACIIQQNKYKCMHFNRDICVGHLWLLYICVHLFICALSKPTDMDMATTSSGVEDVSLDKCGYYSFRWMRLMLLLLLP